MENKQTLFNINYQMEQLEKQKKELKKQLINELLEETTELFFIDNEKEPLNKREIKNLLKGFYQDIKDIIEG
jgi:hypothetical protein